MTHVRNPFMITTLYLLCAVIWVLGTDTLLNNLTADTLLLTGFQHLKGAGFVLATAFCLQVLLVNYQRVVTTEQHAQQALGQTYQTLFQDSYAAMLLIDPNNGLIVDANRAACRFYGYERSMLCQMKITAINMLTAEEVRHEMHLAQQNNRNFFLFRHRLANGVVRDVEVYSGPVQMQGRVLLHSIIHDVSERIKHERERNGLLHLATVLRQAETRANLLPLLLSQARELLGGHSAILWHANLDEDSAQAELGLGVWQALQGHTIRLAHTITGQVVSSGLPRNLTNVADEPLFYRSDLLGPEDCAICALVVNQAHPIGVIWIARDHPFSDEDVRTLMAIADMAASALHRAELHDQTVRRLERIESLAKIDHAIMLSHGPAPALTTLLEVVAEQLHANASVVLLCNPEQPGLECAASHGLSATARSHIHEIISTELVEQICIHPQPCKLAPYKVTKLSSTLVKEGLRYGYAVPLVVEGRSIGILKVFLKAPTVVDHEWLDFLKTLAGQAAIAVERARLYTSLEQTALDLERAYDETLAGWAKALELRDAETEGHSQRVVNLTVQLAKTLGIAEPELTNIRRGALLHDVGKMGISDAILHKPGPLNDEEFKLIQQHPVYAYNWLRQISYLQPVLAIPYSHHERWDGTGYPQQLKGETIPLAARLFALVDVWDALTSDRPYRAAWSPEHTRDYIAAQAGKQFDPALVPVFLKLVGG
ncbi:HD domain-containing phosphohydrolase [Candidatus Viridilinea mediisalina]|uniref:HD-GYP domain-containing protein n=1 Tax=Candidatus Viridilinea mediisalina TaxID=2024553 RepID=A0A2A6RI65_9CHLR|nr:HD domain-containing phosphohydrolase [Candidatus Viridilinea mediisalina]PDW02575.1 hypothetical protein CJ255_13305 [Candidatus Viridilinea mediisalina]